MLISKLLLLLLVLIVLVVALLRLLLLQLVLTWRLFLVTELEGRAAALVKDDELCLVRWPPLPLLVVVVSPPRPSRRPLAHSDEVGVLPPDDISISCPGGGCVAYFLWWVLS